MRLIALANPVEIETQELLDAAGRWASADLVAKRTQPSSDLSAMDGYAIGSENLAGPWTVVGEFAAGFPYSKRLNASEAVRIFTGAVVPQGADTVIMQENVERTGDKITLANGEHLVAQRHVRTAGSDFRKHDILISAGEQINAARVALAAMGGHATISVRRKIRVALISTGDELVAPGDHCKEGQIPASNAVMIMALLQDLPVICVDHGVVPDQIDALTASLRACEDADIIVSFGGASVGDHDLVAPALIAAGAVLDFHKIAMRPGKPVMAGKLGKSIVLGLPGNPVSAYVTALLLLKPLVRHLSGALAPLPKRITTTLGTELPQNGQRIDHLRGIWSEGLAFTVGVNDSAMLKALSASNILIIRPSNDPARTVGETVSCLLIDQ